MIEPKVGRIFLFQPSYGHSDRQSSRQFDLFASKKYEHQLDRVAQGGSLLANCFNLAWAQALNRQLDGEGITHFAMLHDDVVPVNWWLDILIEDLLATGADLMAAVVPIKDWFGLSSTALSLEGDLDRFKVERRLTMTEAFRLPKIFSAADCGYPDRKLLANTGCWVCDITKPWVHQLDKNGDLTAFFTINDRIRKNPISGRYEVDVESEDWFFSRRLGDLGAKVMCTRRAEPIHSGMFAFGSKEPWGEWLYDQAHAHNFGHKPIECKAPPEISVPEVGVINNACTEQVTQLF